MYNSNWYARIEKQVWVKDDGTEEEHDTVVETIWTSLVKASPWIQTSESEMSKIYKDGVFYNDPSEIPS
tara:strand:+ start:2131 stop:2337 length:207 start_codon:yes stop_codon:yes gene_type:complete